MRACQHWSCSGRSTRRTQVSRNAFASWRCAWLQVLRNLSDRSFDKRKAGAQEVEKIMRRLRDTVRSHRRVRRFGPLLTGDPMTLAGERTMTSSEDAMRLN